MLYSRIVLTANGAVFALYGLFLLWQPAYLSGTLGIAEPGAVALTEFRAMYGGLEIALGGLLVWWGLRAGSVWDGLVVLTVSAACLLAGRLLGVLVDASGGGYIVGAAVYEFAVAALGAGGLWLECRRGAPPRDKAAPPALERSGTPPPGPA